MPTLNNALYIGLSGLRTNQQGLNVTGHNISNVNTAGYTRQQVILATNKPIIVSGAVYGTGVNVAQVARYRDAAIDRQFSFDVFGMVVNRASRVMDQAGGGEIVVTKSVHDAAAGAGFAFVALGVTRLKGIAEAEALFRVDVSR